MKNTIITLIVVVLAGIGLYFLLQRPVPVTTVNTTPDNGQATTTNAVPQGEGSQTVIGTSVEGRDIIAYNFGTGSTKILFVGGIHGGYSWNTSLVAYEFMDYLAANPSAIPSNESITVIPVLNPDGLDKVVGTSTRFSASDVPASQTLQISGRYNANNVDVNRNFDCDWQSSAKWQTTTVSGGSAAFSESESRAAKNYVETHSPVAVVIWYSAAGGVYASNCDGPILPETNVITNLYAQASGYPAYESFDFYETTGDMANWLAKMRIPAISVLLTNHTDTEWSKNQKGIQAILQHYAK